MSYIGFKQLPGKGWQGGRQRLFKINKEGGSVEVEDIWIAAALMSHSCRWVDYKVTTEYKPGKFAGTLLGRVKQSGELIFLFIIQGDPETLWERKQLFHRGALYVDAGDIRKNRNFLLDALTEARRQAEAHEKNLSDESRKQG
jgi:hypothetical protein